MTSCRFKVQSLLVLLYLSTSFSSFSQNADFSTSLPGNSNCGGATVTFTINDTTDLDNYYWEFGNGEPDATGIISPVDDGTASSSYVNPGNYTVTLTVNGSIQSALVIQIYAAPEASFVILDGTEEGCLNGIYISKFEYTGTVPEYGAPVVNYTWDFGDGTPLQTTQSTTISHPYIDWGTYNIVVRAEDQNGCVGDAYLPAGVRVNSTPEVDFFIDYASDCSLPINVNYTDSTKNEDGSQLIYNWTFENESGVVLGTSSVQNPSFTYTDAGEYVTTLEVTTNEGGCVDAKTKRANFNANLVAFSPSSDTAICINDTISFVNLSIDGNGGTPISFYWDFGDGYTSTDENPSHVFTTDSGSPFDVSLQVLFSNSCVGTRTVSDLVTVNSPSGNTINVSQDESCDTLLTSIWAVGGQSSYSWDVNYNDSVPSFEYVGSDSLITHLYDTVGVYYVYLEVEDTNGCLASFQYDSINVSFPIADFEVTSGGQGCQLATAYFDASSSSNLLPSGMSDIISYEWDFTNDGIIDEVNPIPTTNYDYSDEGAYDVRLIITTAAGCSDTIVKAHIVRRGIAPIAFFTKVQPDSCINTPVSFSSISIPNPGSSFPIDSIYWDFGDGTILAGDLITNPSLSSVSHVYEDDTEDDGDLYEVRLTVYSNGCPSNIAQKEVAIKRPVARFVIDNGQVDCFGGAKVFNFLAYLPSDPDSLSEGVEQYRWEFGDGSFYPGPTSNEYVTGLDPSVNYSYSSVGDFEVKLFVRNSTTSCEDEYVDTVHVSVGTAKFEAEDTIVCREDAVRFVNTSVTTNSDPVFFWDFGVGATPATYVGENPPTVSYSSNGNKNVTLTLTESRGCIRTVTHADIVSVRGPTPNFDVSSTNTSNNIQCLAPEDTITYTSTTSSTANESMNIFYTWDFGIDAVPQTYTSINENPIPVRYTQGGYKNTTLTVLDATGCSFEYRLQSAVLVPSPIADFDITSAIYCTTDEIDFEDRSSVDNNVSIVSWNWSFGSDATPSTSSVQNPTGVIYSTAANKEVALVVTDVHGCTSSDTLDFVIYEANASFSSPGSVGCAPAPVNFTNESINTVAWEWDFGDTLSPPSTDENPKNIYFYPGSYDVTLVTTSRGGCMDSVTVPSAAVLEGSFYDSISYSYESGQCIEPGQPAPPVTYVVYGFHDTKFVELDFGDGSPSYIDTIPDPNNPPDSLVITHSYSSIGEFTPKLTLTDDTTQATSCGPFLYELPVEPINISTFPEAAFTANTVGDEGCQNKNIKFTDVTENSGGLIDPRYPIVSWDWDFGDGGSSSQQNPKHKYQDTGYFQVIMEVTTSFGCVGSDTNLVYILERLDDPTMAQHDSLCSGTNTTLIGGTPSGGDGTYSYTWQVSTTGSGNWSNAPGLNTELNYTTEIQTPTSEKVLYYRRRVKSSACNINSPIFSVTTFPTTVGGTLGPDNKICAGNFPGTLTLSGYVGSILEWHSADNIDFNGYNVVANTSDSYTYNNLFDTTYYRVVVQSGVCSPEFSDTAIITVVPLVTGNEFTDTDSLFCAGEDIGTLSPTPPQGGNGTFTYQWAYSYDGITFSEVGAPTTPTWSPGGLDDTTYFIRIAYSDINCYKTSNVYSAFVIPNPDTTIDLSDVYICAESIPATVDIILVSSENNVSYQLRRNSDDAPIGVPQIGTGNSLSFTTVAPLITTEYNIFAIPTNTNGDGVVCSGVELDDIATVYVINQPDNSLIVGDVSLCASPAVTALPITVDNTELNVSYTLREGMVDIQTLQGTGSTITFSVNPAPLVNTTYTVYARSSLNSGSCGEIALVDQGVVTVIPQPDVSGVVSDPSVCAGAGSFQIDVTNTSNTVDYSLYLIGTGVTQTLTGNNGTLTFVESEPSQSQQYQVWAKPIASSYIGSCDSIMFPDIAMVTYSGVIDDQLLVVGDTVCINDAATATILVHNSQLNVSYQLRDGTTPVGAPISGNGGVITFTGMSPSTTTTYNVLASSEIIPTCPSVQLANTTFIEVIQTPVDIPVSALPNPANLCSGDVLTITLTGTQIDVKYFLRVGSDTLPGQSIIGNGGNQNFTVSVDESRTYNVYAQPIDQDSDNEYCSGLQLSNTITTVVEGPVSITQQPLTANVCSGTRATFLVLADNAGAGSISYQWYESSDNSTFNPVSDGAVFSGSNSAQLNILNIAGKDNYYYQVEVSTPNCATETSNSAQLVTSPLPDVSGFSFSIDDICLGQGATVNITSNLANNNYYEIFYQASGANAVSYDSVIFEIVNPDGSATASIDASFLTNTGSTALIVSEIDYAFGQQCKSGSFVVSDLFEVQPVPDTNGMSVTVVDVCDTDSALVTISGPNMLDNVYTLDYSITGANSFTGSELVSFVNGESIFYIESSDIANTGTSIIQLTNLAYTTGENCGTMMDFQDSFDVVALPDTLNLSLSPVVVCSGNNAEVQLTGNLVDGNYIGVFVLGGSNVGIDTANIVVTSGMATIEIEGVKLINGGSTTLSLYKLWFDNGIGCSVDTIGKSAVITVEPEPVASNINIYAPNICEGDSALVGFASAMIDGSYGIQYRVSGANATFIDTAIVSLTSGNGSGYFYIPKSDLVESGYHTVVVDDVYNNYGLNCTTRAQSVASFIIEPLPDTSELTLFVNNTCQDVATIAYVSGNLEQGEYGLTYTLSGVNPSYTSITTLVVDASGTGSFEIDGVNLPNAGSSIVSLNTVQWSSGQQCFVDTLPFSANFIVEQTPETSGMAMSSSDICAGDSQVVSFSSNLLDGSYAISYDINGVNFHPDQVDTVTVNSGEGQFIISSDSLLSSGYVSIRLNSIQALFGEECLRASVLGVQTSFTVEASPNITGLRMFAQNVCEGNSARVLLTSNLADGDYMIYYNLSGRNVHPTDSLEIIISNGTGNIIYTIPDSLIPNFGATTITIEEMRFTSGQGCSISVGVSSNFEVYPLPDVEDLIVNVDNVCHGDSIEVSFSSNLERGSYTFLYSLSGANSHPVVEVPVLINDTTGSSSFIVDPNLIVNTGTQSLSIIFVTSHDLGDCGAAVPSNEIVFEIEPTPNVENLSLLVDDICFGYDAIIDVTADSLVDGDYFAVCELTGVNTYARDTLLFTINAGVGEIVLPSDSLVNSGVCTFTLYGVTFITGESCGSVVNSAVGFAVYPDPGSTSLLLSTEDICLGDSGLVQISSIFPDGEYVFVYDLTGANSEQGVTDTISFSSNDGTAVIPVSSLYLDTSGQQILTITEIQVLGVNACTSTGLDIRDTFGIEGVVVIDSIVPSEALCQGNTQSIMVYGSNGGTGNLSYQWYGSQNGSFIQLSDQGVYTGTSSDMLVVSNNTGLNGYEYFCSVGTNQCPGISSDTILFNVLSGSVCGEGLDNLPNAISPNGDGVNDTWVIDGIQNYPGNKVQIFNRWGTLVFEAESYNNSSIVFDGTGNSGVGANQDVTDGTFFFVIDLGDQSPLQKGYLVVNR